MSNTLIVYYSHSGNTRKLANLIAQQIDADCLEIIPEKPYPNDYTSVVNQAKQEISRNFRPALKNAQINLNKYTTIFIGSPNWWSSIAPPIATFIDTNDLSAKKIIPFCTHGGGGFGHIPQDIKRLCKNATVLNGFANYGSSINLQEVKKWLSKLDI
ncbi:flavodoxin [uncultured Megamonas sp.]|uniref:flavodoxin n=1 Tax=uncultured Megamonas sp. TaxID=286140 RepID=UPI00266F1558|nr:flavodoxin [uncultured Megamonas sp.]